MLFRSKGSKTFICPLVIVCQLCSSETSKTCVLYVKMANENRKGGGFEGRNRRNDDRVERGGRGDGRGGRGGRRGGRFDSSERDRSPLRDDRLRDSYVEPFRRRRRSPYPPEGEFELRDPYYQDSFRQDFSDPWTADDPYRRDPYAEPYRDPYRVVAAAPPLAIECEIFVHSPQLRSYGDAVERRVKESNIITAVSVIPEGRTPQQLVEELTSQSTLFAIFINPQNEMHRSLTLNILHGTPQEHRNMPLDDAIALVGRSFLKYIEGLREKGQAATSLSSPGVFLPPSSEISYLLNLLADNRVLTFDELNKVITYLQERRDKLAEAEGRPIFKDDNFGKTPPTQQSSDNTQFPIQEAAITDNKVATSSSSNTDLTSKILSLFSNAGGSVQGVPPANDTQQQNIQSKLPSGTPAPPQAPAPSNASLINFDNPNVQKALDNLINSTPGLLKNINTPLASTQTVATTSGSTTNSMYGAMISSQTPTQNVTPNLGSAVNSMYGAMISSQTQNLVTQNLANSLGSAVNRIYGAMFSSQTLGQMQNPNQVGLSVGYGGIQGQLMANLVQGLQMQPGQISQGTYNMPNQGQTGASYMPSSQSRF